MLSDAEFTLREGWNVHSYQRFARGYNTQSVSSNEIKMTCLRSKFGAKALKCDSSQNELPYIDFRYFNLA